MKSLAISFFESLESFDFCFGGYQCGLAAFEFLKQLTTSLFQGLDLRLELQVIATVHQQTIDRHRTESLLLRLISG